MAESTYERGYRHGTAGSIGEGERTSPSGRLGVFSNMLGPFPLWVWLIIFTIAAVVIYLYTKNKGSTANSNNVGNTGQTPSSLVPQFVNQVYTNPTPPSSPTPNNPQQTQSVPNAPNNPSVTPYDTYAHFGWQAVPGTTAYKLKVYTATGNHLVLDQTVNGLNYDLKNLKPNTSYKYQIQDATTGGSTAWITFKTKPAGGKKPPGKIGGGNPPHVPVPKKPGESED
jgi:hypothetical protein